jgi:hypothetical protein
LPASRAAALGLRLCLEDDNLALAEAVLESARHLDASLSGEPKTSRQEAVETLTGLRLEDAGLSQESVGLLIALKRWLSR